MADSISVDFLIYGTCTSVNGTEEHFLHCRVDRERLVGTSQPFEFGPGVPNIMEKEGGGGGAAPPVALFVRDGMNTYVGRVGCGCDVAAVRRFVEEQLDALPSNHDDDAPLKRSFVWSGCYFHDDLGGPACGIPRGTFHCLVATVPRPFFDRAASARRTLLTFCGSITSRLSGVAGGVHVLMVVFDAVSLQPLSHEGSFDRETKRLRIVDRVRECPESSVEQMRITYNGYWAETPQSHKYCGTLHRWYRAATPCGGPVVVEEADATFFLVAAPLKQREEVEP